MICDNCIVDGGILEANNNLESFLDGNIIYKVLETDNSFYLNNIN